MPDATCSVDGCEGRVVARSYCMRHYQRLRRNGFSELPALPDGRSSKWPGGRRINEQGYATFFDGKRYVLEHRMVMEEHLGRKLKRRENVHHMNGVRDDNRIENLELWVKPQPIGQRPEDLVRWVVDEYPDMVRALLDGSAPKDRAA